MTPIQAVTVRDDRTLQQLDTARQALAMVKTLPGLKEIRDKAEAIGRYARQQQYSLEIANDANEIRLMAERKLGELLKEMDREQRGGDRKSKLHDVTLIQTPKLQDLGISKIQSHRWQQEAALPENAFQAYVTDTRAKGEELTSAAVLRQAKAYMPPSTPREKPWQIEYDVEAFFDLWDRLSPHWQTPLDKARIGGALRGLLLTLNDESPRKEAAS